MEEIENKVVQSIDKIIGLHGTWVFSFYNLLSTMSSVLSGHME